MPPTNDESSPSTLEALRVQIAQGRGEDPLLGPKVGSQVALNRLLEPLTTDRGVHAETLMAVTGVLVGLSVQASLWAEAAQAGERRIPGLQVVCCHDDSRYLVGDPLNRRLMEGYGSPWQLLGEAARQEGSASLPEGEDLLLASIQRLGTAAFGHPQVPPSHTPQVLAPSQQVALWRLILPVCVACCQAPGEWPLLCGLLAARALRLVKPALDPDLAFRLAMESAMDAAKHPILSQADWRA